MTETNWAGLWREISERLLWPEAEGQRGRWQEHLASRFDAAMKRKGSEHLDRR